MNLSVGPSVSRDPLLERLGDFCESRHMMYSEKRWRVALKLREMLGELEAEQIWIAMKADGYTISISCVYQSLSILVQAGVCISTKVKNRQTIYRLHPDYVLTSLGGKP